MDLLHHVFHFPFKDLPDSQDKNTCERLISELVLEFTKKMMLQNCCEPKCDYSKESFEHASMFLSNTSKNLSWFPDYGCVVLYNLKANDERRMIAIHVLSLDKFEKVVHIGGGYQHTADATDFKLLFVGEILEEDLDKFNERFLKFLHMVIERCGKERSAAGGCQGHQRTPAFIHAILRQVYSCCCSCEEKCDCLEVSPVVPVGGFTDVGVHTGGQKRDTCFALVRSLLNWLLDQAEHQPKASSFSVVLAHFYLYILEKNAHEYICLFQRSGLQEKKKLIQRDDYIPAIFHMMECCARLAHELNDDMHHDLYEYHNKLNDVQQKIEEVFKQWDVKSKQHTTIKKTKDGQIELKNHRCPEITRPMKLELSASSTNGNELSELVSENLCSFSMISSKDLNIVSKWAKERKNSCISSSSSILFFLRQVEEYIWGLTEMYFEEALPKDSIDSLTSLVDSYREVLHHINDSDNEIFNSITVQLNSIELLVVWTAYCIVFKSVTKQHSSFMTNFGVALRYKDLKHLSLQDRTHLNILKRIAVFLDKHYIENKDVFSLRVGKQWQMPTFELGELYATRFLNEIWDNEQYDANERVDKHWESVLKKQKLARELREELRRYEEERRRAENNMNSAQYRSWQYRSAEDQRDSAQNKINSTNRKIEEAEKPPVPVIQPLPQNKTKAMKVLFFLHMSSEFRNLSRLSYTAQQLLIPKPWNNNFCGGEYGTEPCDIVELVEVENHTSKWADHYNSYKFCQEYHYPKERTRGTSGHVDVTLICKVPNSENIGPSNINDFYSKSAGVWYPDSCGICMVWNGGSLSFEHTSFQFDPFKIDPRFTASYFTTRLHDKDKELNWALLQRPYEKTHADRVNLPYSSFNKKPSWLSKEGYENFCSMRPYPCMALRNMCGALERNSLPLEIESVHRLLRQTLFQVGELTVYDGKVILENRKDFEDIQEAFIHVLESLVDINKEKPQSFLACQIIGEICCYFSSLAQPTFTKYKDLARALARQVIQWAESYEKSIETTNPHQIPAIRSKQAIFLRIASLCLVNGEFSEKDASLILSSLVKAQNFFVEDDDEHHKRKELKELCQYFLSLHAKNYIVILQKNQHFITDAVSHVVKNCSRQIQWSRYDQSCFEGRSDSEVYHVNPFNGILLVQGLPPTLLPVSITECHLYKQVFGDSALEVLLKDSKFETIQPLKGCYYRFSKINSNIIIEESEPIIEDDTKSPNWDNTLRLIDFKNIDHWGLPKKLKREYTHWFSRKYSVVVLRNFRFSERGLYYIHDFNQTCAVIPEHERNCLDLHVQMKKLHNLESLVIHESPYLHILKRFEDPDFIHTHIKGCNDMYTLSLYRFGLSFRLAEKNTIFESCEISGYKLSTHQHFAGTFRGLENYLVLEKINESQGPDVKLIVAQGKVEVSGRKSVKICDPGDDVNAKRGFFIYEVHKTFKNLVANSIGARLHLACLHVACSLNIMDSMLGMSGEERALELLRQSWVNRPLLKDEKERLQNLKDLSQGSYPAVYILCEDLEKSSIQGMFLHEPNTEVSSSSSDSRLRKLQWSKNITAYEAMATKVISPRKCLTRSEELRLIGVNVKTYRFKSRDTFLDVEDEKEYICPITKTDVDSMYELMKLWNHSEKETPMDLTISKKKFPLSNKKTTTLEKETLSELEESWRLHNELDCANKSDVVILPLSLQAISDAIEKVETMLQNVENYLYKMLNMTPSKARDNRFLLGISLLRLVNIYPTAGRSDIAMISCFPDNIKKFNPLLPPSAQKNVHSSCILWLELCVLRDRLNNLKSLSVREPTNKKAIIMEVQNHREWSVYERPYWLVFECEQGIRIRPEQYVVTNHLMANPGNIVQLNMGLGKTRVILPMLVLYFSFDKSNKHVPRLHILSSLFAGGFDYFHRSLCASVLNRKVFTLPFTRDVELSLSRCLILQNMVVHCQNERGFFMVKPEHQLSLELKQKELSLSKQDEFHDALNKVISSPWFDIVDEIDEVLHYRFQLVYAIGSSECLPQGDHRWKSTQALVHALKIVCMNMDGISIVRDEFVEGFPVITIHNDIDIKSFRQITAGELLDSPPHALKWMKNHKRKSEILLAMVEPDTNPNVLLSGLSDEHRYDVLILRGLIAFDLLIHCLQKRHNVDYGLSTSGKKLMAVPYRGADTPSQRSEYSHPDVLILLTCLSYYYSGLTQIQLKKAFEHLLSQGSNVRDAVYQEWLELSKGRMLAKHYESIDIVDKIDLTNKTQIDNLFQYFKKNTRTIDFWLNAFVFPIQTDQYPKRLVANAWHLADNRDSKLIGFSGTNDNHRILPLQVTQYLPFNSTEEIWQRLLATNGRMLDVICKKTQTCKELAQDKKSVDALKFFLRNLFQIRGRNVQAHALIDSGAILAGNSNREIADFILKECLMGTDLNGITFYDNEICEWMVLEANGRCQRKELSPLHESNTFAIYDEPRCRGVDLRLRSDAIAVMTLGKKMCKDKFMQAAGRMRQLESGQKLIIVGDSAIFDEICSLQENTSNKVDVKAILSWVMHNTVESNRIGLTTWADQGIFFSSENSPKDAVLNEEKGLHALYSDTIQPISIEEVVRLSESFHRKRTGGFKNENFVTKIIKQGTDLGESYVVQKSAADEECERELQREIEEEEEVEIQIPKQKPYFELDWDVTSVLNASSVRDVTVVKSMCIKDTISKNLSQSYAYFFQMNWSSRIFCTHNFTTTVQTSDGIQNDHMRIPNAFVLFPNGDLLLVSDREAERLLNTILNQGKESSRKIVFCHCAFEWSNNSLPSELLRLCSASNKKRKLSDTDACSLKLFNGETSYSGSQRDVLKNMISDANRMKVSGGPEMLVQLRGKSHDYDRSDLEDIRIELLCESEE